MSLSNFCLEQRDREQKRFQKIIAGTMLVSILLHFLLAINIRIQKNSPQKEKIKSLELTIVEIEKSQVPEQEETKVSQPKFEKPLNNISQSQLTPSLPRSQPKTDPQKNTDNLAIEPKIKQSRSRHKSVSKPLSQPLKEKRILTKKTVPDLQNQIHNIPEKRTHLNLNNNTNKPNSVISNLPPNNNPNSLLTRQNDNLNNIANKQPNLDPESLISSEKKPNLVNTNKP
ncbi:MAG: hypothetical protein ACFBSE_25525 [Prochloraceae cyanobacterium]